RAAGAEARDGAPRRPGGRGKAGRGARGRSRGRAEGRRGPARDRGPRVTTLVYLEQTDGAVDEPSLQAATMASSLGGGAEVHAVVAADTAALAPAGPLPVDAVQVAVHDAFGSYAPLSVAEAVVELAGRLGATCVVGPGTERGNEVLAHVAALLDLPLAANCVAVADADADAGVTRVRWGGSLLEEARVDAPT